MTEEEKYYIKYAEGMRNTMQSNETLGELRLRMKDMEIKEQAKTIEWLRYHLKVTCTALIVVTVIAVFKTAGLI